MFATVRLAHPGKPLWLIGWWHVLALFCFYWVGWCYRLRAWGATQVPRHGPVLLVANHQSFLDPIVVGLGCRHRQFGSMARSNLFDHWLFAWLIRSLGAIPVKQGIGDKSALRRCIDVLKTGQTFLIFPEGARTIDGKTHRFSPGTMLLIKRARPHVVPVAIEGAFRVWPQIRRRPGLSGQIHIRLGRPIPAETLIQMGSTAALDHLHDQIETMRQELAKHMGRSKRPGEGLQLSRRAI